MRQAATNSASAVAPFLVRPVLLLLLLEVVVDRGVDGAGAAAADSRGRPGKSSVLEAK